MRNEIVYTSKADSLGEYFKKIWRYRNLIWVFAKRDLQVKYAQTILGISWGIIQPLTSLIIFSVFFGYILNWKADGLPYPLYVLSGLLGWNYFTYIAQNGSLSLQESGAIIKKIYFPKSILPFSKIIIASMELIFSLLLLIPLMVYYDQPLSWKIVFLPFVLLFNVLCGLSLVFWIGSLTYKKRDLFQLMPFLIFYGIWFTPVFFSNEILPSNFQKLMDFNPIANVIGLWRWMLFGTSAFQFRWLISFLLMLFICLSGMFVFNAKENKFSDFI